MSKDELLLQFLLVLALEEVFISMDSISRVIVFRFNSIACRTGGLAGPARYKSARTKRENEREAQGKKYPLKGGNFLKKLWCCVGGRITR